MARNTKSGNAADPGTGATGAPKHSAGTPEYQRVGDEAFAAAIADGKSREEAGVIARAASAKVPGSPIAADPAPQTPEAPSEQAAEQAPTVDTATTESPPPIDTVADMRREIGELEAELRSIDGANDRAKARNTELDKETHAIAAERRNLERRAFELERARGRVQAEFSEAIGRRPQAEARLAKLRRQLSAKAAKTG